MGKYMMRKRKKTMEISHSSSAAAAVGLGVKKTRTRARTSVAVLQSFSSSSSASVPRIHRAVRRKQNACSLVGFDESTGVSSCSKKQRCTTNAAAGAAMALNNFSYPNTRSRARGANFSRNPHGEEPKATVEKPVVGLREAEQKQEEDAMEVCCGETEGIFHDKQSRDRNGSASTPSPGGGHCQSLEAPGSTTRSRRKSTETGTHAKEEQGRRIRRRERERETQTQEAAAAPSSHEMEDFFAGAEQQQHRFFIERYNYDPVNDMPLPGRYEWMRLKQ